jgi:hypothetical protein
MCIRRQTLLEAPLPKKRVPVADGASRCAASYNWCGFRPCRRTALPSLPWLRAPRQRDRAEHCNEDRSHIIALPILYAGVSKNPVKHIFGLFRIELSSQS